uniref:ARAD1A19580p n=1 Tax=Blastobotrys adeninivorans TaxID=409370 RepID=A0A060SYB1_BLAAD
MGSNSGQREQPQRNCSPHTDNYPCVNISTLLASKTGRFERVPAISTGLNGHTTNNSTISINKPPHHHVNKLNNCQKTQISSYTNYLVSIGLGSFISHGHPPPTMSDELEPCAPHQPRQPCLTIFCCPSPSTCFNSYIQGPETMFGQNRTSGFGSFGSNSSNQTGSGLFGGSGSSAFGQNSTNNASGGGLFGSNSTNTTGGGLFGQNNANNASSGGSGLFGSSTNQQSSGFGGFGSSSNTSNVFGSGSTNTNTGGGLFGSKPAGTTSGGGLFGSSTTGTTGSAFGSSSFGSGSTGAGAGGNQGTAIVPFSPFEEKDTTKASSQPNAMNSFQSICAMPQYQNFSPEELRWQDYQQNRRYGQGATGATSTTGSPFGQNTSSSPFGNTSGNTSGFGGFGSTGTTSNTTGGGLFGSQTQNQGTSGAFGSSSFGSNSNTQSGGGLFGKQPASSPFGSANTGGSAFGSANTTSGFGSGGFGQNSQQSTGTGFGFGQNNTSNTSGGGLFGQNNQQQNKPFGSTGGFGSNTTSSPFGGSNTNTGTSGFGGFGSSNTGTTGTGGGLFGSSTTNTSSPFGAGSGTSNTGTGTGSGFSFGSTANNQNQNQNKFGFGGGFGSSSTTNTGTTGGSGLFGQSNTGSTGFGQNKPGGLFGQNQTQQNTSGGLFGQNQNQQNTSGGLFGQNQNQQNTSGGLFGQNQNQQNTSGGGLFGSSNTTGTGFGATSNTNTSGGLFGSKPATTTGGGLFGQNNQNQAQGQQPSGGGLFGNTSGSTGGTSGFGFGSGGASTATGAGTTGGGLFGANNANKPATGGGLFGNTGTTNTGTTGGGLFGNTQQGQQGTGTGTLGTGTGTQGGLFGGLSNNLNKPATGGLSLGSGAGTGGGLFGSQQNAGAQNQGNQSLVASIDQNPYGSNPLFQPNASLNTSAGSGTGSPGPMATPLSGSAQKKNRSMVSAYKLAPKPLFVPRGGASGEGSTPQKPRTVSGASPGATAPRDEESVKSPRNNSVVVASPAAGSNASFMFSPRADDAILSSEAFSPRQSVRKLIISRRRGGLGSPQQLLENSDYVDGDSNLLLPTPSKEKSNIADGFPEIKKDAGTNGVDGSVKKSPEANNKTNNIANSIPDQSTEAPKAVEETRRDEDIVDENGYWISPSAEKLQHMSLKELEAVKNFKVGRKGMGHITFNQPVDLSGFSNVALQVPGRIVVVANKTCSIYPNEKDKPPAGKGLNVAATITIQGIWAHTKDTREPVRDPSHPLYNKHINRLKSIKYTEFVSWDRETGTWVFKIDPAKVV